MFLHISPSLPSSSGSEEGHPPILSLLLSYPILAVLRWDSRTVASTDKRILSVNDRGFRDPSAIY